jgi:hypothetical protein
VKIQWVAVVCAGLLVGCGNAATDEPALTAVPDTAGAAADNVAALLTAEDGVVLIERSADRVRLVERGGSRYLHWESLASPGLWERVWRSRDIYSADPNVLLEDLNGDGRIDLYWSLAFEEIAGAMVVLRTSGGARELLPELKHCGLPQLERVKAGFRLMVSTPGVYQDCRDMDIAICTAHFHTTIPRTLLVEGDELVLQPVSSADMIDLARQFRNEAHRADSLMTADAIIPRSATRYSDVCEPAFPGLLEALADSLDLLVVR